MRQIVLFVRAFAFLLAILCFAASLSHAQVTLNPPFPTEGQAGSTLVNITGANFPADAIGSVNVRLRPAAGGPETVAPATLVRLLGTTSRVTFLVPHSIIVTSPVPYLVSVSGSTTSGVVFLSVNAVTLTINPASSVVLSPNSAQAGTSLEAHIVGSFTSFVQGATSASFGPGISVQNNPLGASGFAQVTGPVSATVHIGIDASAAPGIRNVVIGTGAQKASATFNVLPQDLPPLDPAPPVAHAGAQQLVPLGSLVHLDGTQSTSGNGGTLTFEWSFLSKPPNSTAGLSDPGAVNPSFVADKPGDYVAQLKVTEGTKSSSASVTITTSNTAPSANAGLPQSVALGATVVLDGSASTDVDGDSISYLWEITSKPESSSAALSGATEVSPSFTPDLPGTYVVQVTVNDGHNHTATASVGITTLNAAPTARAGNPQTVTVGSNVQLDGAASSDPDGDTLSFGWVFTARPAGSVAALLNAATSAPSFTADIFGTYVVQLTVNDGNGHLATATVSIDTSNSPPIANAGSPQTVAVGTTVELNGGGSSDPDHQPLTYKWSLLSRPSGSTASLSSLTAQKPTFTADRRGFYVAQLLVSDGTFTSAPSTVLITATAPEFVAEPTVIDFGDQPVGSTSTSREIQIENPGNGPLNISQISLAGANPGHFALSSAALPIAVAPGKKTTVSVSFAPTLSASLSALLEFQNNAENSPHRISLLGRGIAPVISYTPGNVDFGTQTIGVASSPRTVTISNSGTSNLVISELRLAGNHPQDFQLTAGPLPITVAPGSNVTAQLKFAPTNIGTRTGTFVLTTNAAGSPHVIALAGNGSGAQTLIEPVFVEFGDQIIATAPKTQSVLISNEGNADLVISNLAITGPNSQNFGFSAQTLPLIVAPGSSASINVIFDPQTSGPQAATLSIEDNSTNGPQLVALAGTGLAPEISYSPGSVTFPNQAVGATGAPAAITVTNIGTSDLVISEIAFVGGSPGDFSSSTLLPIVVAPTRSTTISVAFQPTASGMRSASLVFSGNASGSPHVVGLQGTGVAPGVSLLPASLSFADQALNVTSSPRQFTITNSGTALLTISSLSLTGPCAAQFAVNSPALPISLAPGQSSSAAVTFTPVELMPCSATLNIGSNAPGGPHPLALAGKGIGTPGISVSPLNLDFGNQILNVAGTAKTLTVSNAGTQALVISSIAVSGFHSADFAISTPAVPLTLAPGESATVDVTFTAGALGARSATLNFVHNGTASPRTVSLTGTGTAPAATLSPGTLIFGNQEVGSPSALKQLVISNVGSADLVISGLALSPASPEFELNSNALPITVPPGGSTTVNVRFTPAITATYSTSLIITDNAGGSPRAVPISGTGASALIGIVPSMLSFGSQGVNTSSAPMAVTVSNPGTVNLVISSLALDGAASADFSISAPSRPITLVPGATTTISITFTPKASGSRLASLVITDNATGGPHSVTLSGTGASTGTTVSIFPTSVAFGNQALNTVSAAKFVAVSNTGGTNLVISALNITGAAASDFSHSVTLPMTVGPGSSASLPVIFKPSALGLRVATLTFVDNGAGGPRTVDLNGTGIGTPQFSVAPTSIAFGNQNVGTTSSAHSVVVTNTGTDNLVISNLSVFGFGQAGDFNISSAPLPITVAPNASTTINLTFKPGVQGPRSSTLSIVDNAVGSPHTVALSGVGTAPQISVLPQAVIFGSQAVGSTSSTRVVTLGNSGTGPMLISSLAVSGPAAGDFAMNPGPLPVTVQPGASIPVNITFTPGATGARSATLTISHDASGGNTALSMSGTGIVSGPALSLNPGSLSFGNQQVSTSSSALILMIENPGTANLVVSSLSLTGADAGEFAVNASAMPLTIIPGGNAMLHVAFTPASPGPRSASLGIVHNAEGSPQSVPLTGTGIAPTIGITPAVVSFPNQTVNTQSSPMTVTIGNSGTGPLNISDLSVIGINASEFLVSSGPLPISVAPGASTTLNVVFQPADTGSRSATLVISDNANGTPHMLGLNGNGQGTGANIVISPLSVNFGSQALNSTSVSMPVVITNTGNGNLKVSSVSISGNHASDFAATAPGLPVMLGSGSSIVVSVTFSPQQSGMRSATLTIGNNADNTTPPVSLNGTGFSSGPAISLAPQLLTFGNQPIGVASQPVYVAVSNTGTSNLVIAALQISGANASDFSLFGISLPMTVAPSSSGAIGFIFTPSGSGARSASVGITDNATGSPHSVEFSGTGTQPLANIGPSSINFGSQPALTVSNPAGVVISNVGNAPLVITSLGVSPSTVQFQVASPGLPLSIAPGSSATVNVAFAPTTAGPYSAELVINHNATGSPDRIALNGSGTTVGIGIAPSSINFGNQQMNVSSSASEVVISNPGSAPLVISSLSITGTHAADYAATALALPITVPPGGSTSVNLVFTPKALGVRSAILVVTDNAVGSPHSVTISGTGVGVAGLSINPASLSFGNQPLNTASTAQTLNISNPGSSNLVVSNLAVTGSAAAEFALTATPVPITVAPGASTNITVRFTPLNLGARSASLSISSNVGSGILTVPLSGTGVGAPASTVAPTSLLFGNQAVGSSSAAQAVTVTNSGSGDLLISSISLSGGNPSEFAFSAGPLPILVLPGNSASISVMFTPSSPGSRTANLNIVDNAAGSPRSIGLSGTGASPAINVSPSTVNLGNQTVQTTSAAQQVVLSNTGSAPLTISSLSLTGPNPGEFAVTPPNPLPLTIAPGTSASVDVTFSPISAGVRVATLNIVHNAGAAQSVALSGTGTVPNLSITPGTLSFGSQAVGAASSPLNVTLTNSGSGTLIVSNITFAGAHANDFAYSGPLPVTIGPNASKPVGINFNPTQAGSRSATLVLASNAPGSPHVVGLSGTGVAPAVTLTPSSLAFGTQPVNTTSGAKTVTVGNNGTSNLVISAVNLSGANPGDFSFSPAALPITVVPGTSVNLSVTFAPLGAGSRTGSLNITHNGPGGVGTVSLTGTGEAIAGFGISPNALNFGTQTLGSASLPAAVTIANGGTVGLVVSGLTLTGAQASEFAVSAPALPITVPAGGSIIVNVTFTPAALGARLATLTIADNAPGSPHTVPLSGTGVGQPVFSASPGSLNFGTQLVGTSSSINLTLSNTGTDMLVISALNFSGSQAGEFGISGSVQLPLVIAPGASSIVMVAFTPVAAGQRVATLNVASNASGAPHLLSLTGIGGAPAVQLSPASLTFGGQQVNTTSAQQQVTITNNGTTSLFISGLTLSGTNAADFSMSAGTLPINIPVGGSTVVNVTFTPKAVGARSASLTIMNNAPGNPHSVPLTGTGVTPGISVSPSSFNFGNQAISTSSNPSPITVTNTGTGDLIISNLTFQGENPSEFTVSSPATPVTVAPGASVNIQLVFRPTAIGLRSATLSIGSNASGGPHTASLFGVGTAPTVSLNPTSITFSNQNVGSTSSPRTLTVNNTGSASLVISAISISGANAAEFGFTAGTLPITVPAGQSAEIQLAFSPTAPGQRTASVVIASNATASPHSVSLAGAGTQPGINLNPASLSFGEQPVNQASATKPVVISNPGNGDLIITALTLAGPNSAEFSYTSASLPITVAPSSNATLNVRFTPTATGARTASLVVTSNANGSPQSVPLSGIGTQPVIGLSTTAVSFGSRDVNTTSPATTVTVSNTGTGSLVISAISLSGTNAGDFGVTPSTAPVTVAPGTSVDLQVTFSPKATGPRAANLLLTHNAAGSPSSIALSGTGVGPIVGINPGSLSFGSRNVGSASPFSELTVNNTGNGNLIISSISISGVNAGDFAFIGSAIPITVAPGGNTVINVSFTPAAAGARTANLNLVTNATTSPHAVLLTGTGSGAAATVNPSSLDFGTLALNTNSNPVAVTISNSGNANLVISAIAVSGAAAGDFAFTAAARPITLAAGANTTVNVTFTPKQVGLRSATLTITHNAPGGGTSTVAMQGSGTGSSQVVMQPVTVGANLEVLATASLTSIPPSDVPVTITSADPSRVLLRDAFADISGTGAGSPSITMNVRGGTTSLFPGFWVQGLASSGTVNLTLSAPNYASATVAVTLTRSGFVLISPLGQGANFTTNSGAQNVNLTVAPVMLDGSNNVIAGVTGRVAGGLSVNVPVSSQTTSVGTIVGSPVSITGGSTGAGVQFDPNASGSSLLSAGTPSGYFTPASGSQLTATVSSPKLTLGPVNVGTNLQVEASGAVESGAPSGGLSVTIASSNSGVVLLSTNPSLQGTASITLNVAAGQTFLPSYYVQAVGASGSVAQITATASNYQSSTANVSVTNAGFVITGPSLVPGQAFTTSTISLPTDLHVQVVQLSGSMVPVGVGQIRGGLSVSVPVNSSTPSIGTIGSSPATFSAGNSSNNNVVSFNPQAQGSTVVSLGTPNIAGFSTPSSGASLTVNVTQPQITLGLASSTIGKDLQVLGSGNLSAVAPIGGLGVTIRVISGSGVLLSTTSTGAGSTSVVVTVPQGSVGGGSFPAYYVQGTAASGTAIIQAEAAGWDSAPVTITLKPSGFVINGPNGMGQDFGTIPSSNDTVLTIESWQLNEGTLVPEHRQAPRGGLSFPLAVTSSNTSVGTISGSPVSINGTNSIFGISFHPIGRGASIISFTQPAGFTTPMSNGKALNSLTADVN